MQGTILIVDAIATNRIVLKVKLKTVFYDVVQAATMDDAVRIARAELPDLVISALSLPDGSAADLCKTLLGHSRTENIPIIAIGCQPDTETRMTTLEAGVHDVLDQPVDETLLLGRVRSLIRASHAQAEWQMREDTCRALGFAEPSNGFEEQAHCALVCADKAALQGFATKMRQTLRCKLSLANVNSVMQQVADEKVPDVFVLFLSADPLEALQELRLISTLRAAGPARHAGVIVVQQIKDGALGANALDLGADDLMTDGFDAAELALRIKAVMRRKRMGEHLRASVRTGLQAAVFDPLTGLYNRRYAMPHLGRTASRAHTTGRCFAVMAADLDHFKRINDVYGHASGDAVLVDVARRLRQCLRGTDMVARIGGEEFMIILPGTSLLDAQATALRLCTEISATPFKVPGSKDPISVTVSVGVAISAGSEDQDADPEEIGRRLLEQADQALYAAKGKGRNQVKFGRPAA